jgi:outer membrane lipoprotein SlyB
MRTQSPIPIPLVAALAATVLVLLPGPEMAPEKFAASARPPCANCGVVEIVRVVEHRRGEPAGAPEGRHSESVLGYRMGGGGGEGFVMLLGAMAGASPAKRARLVYEVDVRLEDGSVRTFLQPSEPPWRLGDRVRVIQGRIIGLS